VFPATDIIAEGVKPFTYSNCYSTK